MAIKYLDAKRIQGSSVGTDTSNGGLTFLQSATPASFDTTVGIVDVKFSADGTKAYLSDGGQDSSSPALYTIYQYPLTTAWDLSTMGSATLSTSVGQYWDYNPTGIFPKSDGTKFFMAGNQNDSIAQWDDSGTAWTFGGASSHDGNTGGNSLDSYDTEVQDLFFGNSGQYMYIIGTSSDKVHRFDLASAWTLPANGTALDALTHTEYSVVTNNANPTSLWFTDDGKTMLVGSGSNVGQYALTTAWQISSGVTYIKTYDVSAKETSVQGVTLGDSETKLFICGTSSNQIHKYNFVGDKATFLKNSASFDGTGDNAQVTTPLVTGTGNFTISGWIYPTANDAYNHFISTYDSGTTDWALLTASGVVKWYTEGVATDSSGVTLAINTWHHIAIKRTGTTISFVIDGTVSGNTFTRNSDYNSGGSGTFSIGAVVGASGSQNFKGYMADVAVWDTAITDAKLQAIYNDKTLANATDSGDLVAYYPLSSDYTDQENTGTDYDLTTAGNTAISNTVTSPIVNLQENTIFEETDTKRYYFLQSGAWKDAFTLAASRACFGGGESSSSDVNTIDYVTIGTTGNAADFGDLTQAREGVSACSNRSRGVFSCGNTGSDVNTMDYITIGTLGDATDFGDATLAARYRAGCSNQSRGLIAGGYTTSGATKHNVIEYITMDTTGAGTDFGDLIGNHSDHGACDDGSRAVIGGGQD